ncbi:MAG TPA: type II toxin-antitoxin system RelE/ParE family toxin [Stellaceae bacterium]|jgi:proteic killer suppression protein|nr:type II toxin-antitoxin system RelE/ParE family toxin [Stellaceae bacterium]
MPVRSCLDRNTQAFIEGKRVRAFEQCAKRANIAIAKLQAAEQLIDLRNPPSNHFEALAGAPGRYSIRIDGKWRLCFGWRPHEPEQEEYDILTASGDAIDVEISNHYE